jgi:hypothetical protein
MPFEFGFSDFGISILPVEEIKKGPWGLSIPLY